MRSVDTSGSMALWWQTPQGKQLLLAEKQQLLSLSSLMAGTEQLQIGVETPLLPMTHQQGHQWCLDVDVMGHVAELPFRSQSVDVVLLVHVLAFASDPHQVIREVDRILVDDGVLVVSQFNWWQCWRVSRACGAIQPARYLTIKRIKDWLDLLGYDLLAQQSIRVGEQGVLSRLNKTRLLVAQKRTIPLTPIMARRRWKAADLLPPRVSSPVGRAPLRVRKNSDG